MINSLLSELERRGKEGPLKVIRGRGAELAVRIRKEETPPEKTVILGGRETLGGESFADIIQQTDEDKGRAFAALVDAGEGAEAIDDHSYVRLLEMTVMALRLAAGRELNSAHRFMNVDRTRDRVFIFTPRMEKTNAEYVNRIYERQKDELMRSADRGFRQ